MSYETFQDRLILAGIDVACEKMGYCFEKLFLHPCKSGDIPYEDYYWCVYTTTDTRVKPDIYIHAIPPADAPAELPWEEWFVMEGDFHHHVCYKTPMPRATNFVHIRSDDQDHPLYTLDKEWHWYIDPDITPVLYRKAG